ncbi:MAG: hypothetical protein A2V67_12445 [Deltaproteobacteria bacterium RBG_13_61_14]|nr:MAG: hypothetical protein A2V67_12445 [Deltaproteobacteria bacterium RBG_13_61_14]
MSHTSQRRGLSPEHPGEEIIVLAMIPGKYKRKQGIGEAMAELAEKMLAHGPSNWLSRNFPDLDIPQLGSKQALVRLMSRFRPEATRALLLRLVAERSSVLTAIYTDPEKVIALLQDLQGEWLKRNREKGYPISIVLSGLFGDIHQCCGATGLREHTYLHSLGFRGRTERLPAAGELELLTMCGHGLISVHLVQHLVKSVRQKQLTARQAAEEIAQPCICGIVNQDRAEKVFLRLAQFA